jgi:trimeric autotransporter adhesin
MQMRLQEFSGFAIILLLSACGDGGIGSPPAPVVTTVSISAPSTTVAVGGSMQLTASATDANGNAVTGMTATWASSNQVVATVVSTSGVVSGVAAGSVTITATINGIAGSKGLTVTPFPAAATVQAGTGVVFDPLQVDITAGGTVTWAFATLTHNVTFSGGTAGTPANIGNTSSASVARTFTTAGTFNYTCTLHAGMNGTVVVH